METVEVVIKIQKDLYETLKANIVGTLPKDSQLASIFTALISLGTVLPKGHGRLADMDEAMRCLEETADCKVKQYAIGMLEWAMAKRTIIVADEEKPNMMQKTMGFLKNLYLQNKDDIDRTAKEFYSKRNELTCIELLEELRQQIWDITSKHLDSQRYALIRKADVLDFINQHLSDMQRNVPTVIEADKEVEE